MTDHKETAARLVARGMPEKEAERLALHVAKVVSEAPPLTDEQRVTIANLLAPYARG